MVNPTFLQIFKLFNNLFLTIIVRKYLIKKSPEEKTSFSPEDLEVTLHQKPKMMEVVDQQSQNSNFC
jgi:hypothetical protein